MIRKFSSCSFVFVVALLCWGESARAGVPVIEKISVGLPADGGGISGRSRRGSWSPVYVTLESAKDGNAGNEYQLVVQATDTEETPYHFTVPIPALPGHRKSTVIAYFRPIQFGNELEVMVKGTDGTAHQQEKHVIQDTAREIVGAGALLFGSLGSQLVSMKSALLENTKKEENVPDEEDRGARRFVFIERVELLPDQWIGYDSADVLILTSGSASFIDELTRSESKRNALLEWVRRGGKLVISVGSNHQLVAALLEKMPGLIDATVKGSTQRETFHKFNSWSGGNVPLTEIELAVVEPGPRASILIQETRDDTETPRPVMLQGACGMGRVLLVCVDLDSRNFKEWKGQAAFWRKMKDELTVNIKPRQLGEGLGQDTDTQQNRQEILSEMQRGLETFPDVPVISFGWVALFIFFYILLVGPIDYFILKKIFKRLEWTWITFPATVILISVIAYFVAFQVKGDDLRVNKVDLVDIDLHDGQVYGKTWWSVFSPRITTYTLGVEPSPEWVAEPKSVGVDAYSPTVGLLATPDRETRFGAQSLFPRPYDYTAKASGMKNVPIPVWSTRSFEASWRAPLSRTKPAFVAESGGKPGLEFDLETKSRPKGRIQNNLPTPLEGVTFFFRGKWYEVGTLAPGESRRIERFFEAGAGRTRDQWFRNLPMKPVDPEGFDGSPVGSPGGQSAYEWLPILMFHSETASDYWINSGLRHLDQGWRLRPQPQIPQTNRVNYRDEVVLVGRTAVRSGEADTTNKDGVTASRLWLGGLPGKDEPKAMQGFMMQQTYVRVFIPVRRPD